MAKKKEEKRSYLSCAIPGKANKTGGMFMPLPDSEREYTQTKMSFSGIDRRSGFTGDSADALNVSFSEYPSVKSSPLCEAILKNYEYPESIHSIDSEHFIVFYRVVNYSDLETDSYDLYLDYIKVGKKTTTERIMIPVDPDSPFEYDPTYFIPDDHTFVSFEKRYLSEKELESMSPDILPANTTNAYVPYYTKDYTETSLEYTVINAVNLALMYNSQIYPFRVKSTSKFIYNRVLTIFNKLEYDSYPIVVTDVNYSLNLISFPERMPLRIDKSKDTLKILPLFNDLMPPMKAAVSHHGRLYGGDADGAIYVSKYNDYSEWELDTPDNISSGNAWMTHTQVDKGHAGGFMAFVSFGSNAIGIARNRIYAVMEANSTFRTKKIAEIGTIDARSVCSSSSSIYFLAYDGIYSYDGSSLGKISSPLGDIRYSSGCTGFARGKLYFYSEDLPNCIWVYNTEFGVWSRIADSSKVLSFAEVGGDMFALCEDGTVLCVESEYNKRYGEFSIETNELIGDSIKERRIKRIDLLCEAQGEADIRVYVLQNGADNSATHLPVCEYSGGDFDQSSTKRDPGGIVRLSARVNLPAHNCERIRICGHGNVKIHALSVSHTYI